ncbi:NEDD8-activating enzyme E1 regulatory subunit [Meredithblackwellia eburnea MCA 4105]
MAAEASVLPPPVQDSVALDTATTATANNTEARPDLHQQKYDRQLRLWAKTGQSALETAHILVVNATATAASTLKNLVLPGIGTFTILDPATTDGADIGNNFFLEPSSLGKPRAEEVTRLLLELNSDVKGIASVQDLGQVLSKSPADLAQFSLIIAVDVDPNNILQLADIAWDNSIPLIKVRSCGFYGSLRTQIRELAIVETHPESLIDLRIHNPFPSLIEYARSFDFESMDSEQHGHIPAVVILVRALEDWKATHDGKGPIGTEQRNDFVKSISTKRRSSDEENFDEASALFRRAGVKPKVPTDIEALFKDPACENLTSTSSNFWILLRAVRNFVEHPSSEGLLPLSGALPDMKADTQRYVGLQTVYRTKARQDLALVEALLSEILSTLGLPPDSVSKDEADTFVKHSAFLKVVRGRSLRQEAEDSLLKGQIESLAEQASWDEIPNDALYIYLGFRASEAFFVKFGRYPGAIDTYAQDHLELSAIAGSDLAALNGGVVTEELSNVLLEICRSGASDLPQIAALLGGLVAQEAIKLVTKQYIPLNGTSIFNGIKSASGVIVA